MEKKIIRGFTIHEVETKEGNGIDFNVDGDLTYNQLMCLCAMAMVNVMGELGEDEHIDVANRIKRMILNNDPKFISYCYLKACELAKYEDE